VKNALNMHEKNATATCIDMMPPAMVQGKAELRARGRAGLMMLC
jgi:hypothetical protein